MTYNEGFLAGLSFVPVASSDNRNSSLYMKTYDL